MFCRLACILLVFACPPVASRCRQAKYCSELSKSDCDGAYGCRSAGCTYISTGGSTSAICTEGCQSNTAERYCSDITSASRCKSFHNCYWSGSTGSSSSGSDEDSGGDAGDVIVGLVIFTFFVAIVAFTVRRCMINKRKRQAEEALVMQTVPVSTTTVAASTATVATAKEIQMTSVPSSKTIQMTSVPSSKRIIVICDVCQAEGSRQEMLQCSLCDPSFDICPSCHGSTSVHNHHNFYKFTTESDRILLTNNARPKNPDVEQDALENVVAVAPPSAPNAPSQKLEFDDEVSV